LERVYAYYKAVHHEPSITASLLVALPQLCMAVAVDSKGDAYRVCSPALVWTTRRPLRAWTRGRSTDFIADAGA
jgi:hypothetical protein